MMLSHDQIRSRAEKALRLGGGAHTLDDLIAHAQQGLARWIWDDQALVITQLEDTERGRECIVYVAAGDLDHVMDLQPQVVEHARAEGCTRLVMRGRKGWSRVLPSYGWRHCGDVGRFTTWEFTL